MNCVADISGPFCYCTILVENGCKRTGMCTFYNMFPIWLFCWWPLSIGAEVAIVDGFDCSPTMINTTITSSERFCSGSVPRNLVRKEVSLLQRSDKLVVTGVECFLTVSVFNHYCGEFSHNHVIEAATISESVFLSRSECLTAFRTEHLIYENQIIKVNKNKVIRKKFFVNGTVVLTSNLLNEKTITCFPKGIYIKGTFIPAAYQSMEIVFSMAQIELLQSSMGMYTLTKSVFLGKCESFCFAQGKTYVNLLQNATMEQRIYNSRIRFIRKMTVDKFKMGNITYLRNITEGFFIKVGQKINVCFVTYCIHYYETEISNLLIFSKPNIFPMINSFEIDISLEAKLEITSETRLLLNIIDNQPFLINICKSLTSSGNIHNMFDFYGQIVEFRGELVFLHACTKIHFEIVLGKAWPCYNNVFVFEYQGILKAIKPFTRMVMGVQNLQKVQCNKLPTFLELGGGKFMANLGDGMEIKYFSNFPSNVFDVVLNSLFTDTERIQDSVRLNKRFHEIKNNIYLSQMSTNELETLSIEPGVWFDVASWFSNLDFLNPYTWVKMCLTVIGILGGAVLLVLLIYLLAKTIINIKCFERHHIALPAADLGNPQDVLDPLNLLGDTDEESENL